jgi:hypothetical protein
LEEEMNLSRIVIVRLALSGLAVATSSVLAAESPKAAPAAASVVVKGVVATAKGPLANVTIVLSPIDPKTGLAVTVYARAAGGDTEMANPKVRSDAKGAFSVAVPRTLFVETPPCAHECAHWAADRLGVMVWPEAGTKEPLEPAVVKCDTNAATVDVGRVVLEPMK